MATKVNPSGRKAVKPGDAPRPRKGKPLHPGVGSKDENVYPFKEVPPDYAFDEMKPLKKRDFSDDATFYDYRAAELRHRADKLTAKATETRAMGTKAQRSKAKRLTKLMDRIAGLRGELEKEGLDVEALLAAHTPQ